MHVYGNSVALTPAKMAYVLEHSAYGDPWEFRAVFTSTHAAEEALVSTYGILQPDQLEMYRLSEVQCDIGVWGGLSHSRVVQWSSDVGATSRRA